MGEGAWLVAFLVIQRLAELVFANSNTARLRAKGAVEFGASHYPLIVLLHACGYSAAIGRSCGRGLPFLCCCRLVASG